MKKKTIIWIIVAIVVIATIIGSIATVVLTRRANKPENVWQQYVAYINEQNYDEMYNMITEDSKAQISKDDFVKRNKNIYDGIDMTDMQIQITSVEKENNNTSKISYNQTMDTDAGNVEFENTVRLTKDREKGYLVNWSSSLIFPTLGSNDKVRIKTISAERGSIIDKNGQLLAGSGSVSSVGIVPKKLSENKDADIEKMAELLGMTADSINKSLSALWVKDDSFVPIKKIAMDATDLKNQLLQIPGVKITTAKGRTYPLGEASAQLVGYVQTITAEELELNRGKGYTSTSVIGKSGLEKQYEERLKGKDGVEIYIEGEDGKRKTDIAKIDVQNGETIKLTIDSTIQTKLYNELKDNEGFFVVMHPKTGALLALVSTPSYNPNSFTLGMGTDEWNNIKNDERNPMLTRYLQSYCPGSTFKTITGAIGLTTETLSTEDTFQYSGLSWKKDIWGANDDITTLTAYDEPKNLKNALIHSDNIYFAQAILQIGKKNFTDELDKIKFNENIDFGLTTSKSQYANKIDIPTEKTLADSGYGQGEILVNPIHMASIYSAFANDGNMIKPYIEEKENNQVEYLVENAFSKESANIIKEDLIQVVENPEGTANDMRVDGRTIAGKTGTAELKASKDAQADVLGWFDCFTTDDNENQLLVVSMVENGRDLGGSHYLISKIKTLF